MPIPAVVARDALPVPARELVLDNLRTWIVEGTLAPGEIIKDTEVADAFAVSRTPVREALLQLRSEGLVEMKPKGWTQVKLLDLGQVEHLLPVVVDLEMLAARLAARNPQRDLAEAEQAQRALETRWRELGPPATPEQAQQLVAANDRFHDAILAIAGNPFLAGSLRPLKALMRRYERYYFALGTRISAESIREHEDILDAIRHGDAEAAAAAAERNFANSPLLARANAGREGV